MEKLIVDLIAGAVGANVAGAADKKNSLGTIGNTIAGLAGGAVGSQILEKVVGNLVTGVVGDIGGAAISGAVTIYIVNLIKKHFFNKNI